MARKRAGEGGNQMGLPTLEWYMCMCGCGSSFLQGEKGRKREYLNDSHKKRAYRDRTKEREAYDAEAKEAYYDWTSEAIEVFINSMPGTYAAWLGQWELYRRSR